MIMADVRALADAQEGWIDPINIVVCADSRSGLSGSGRTWPEPELCVAGPARGHARRHGVLGGAGVERAGVGAARAHRHVPVPGLRTAEVTARS